MLHSIAQRWEDEMSSEAGSHRPPQGDGTATVVLEAGCLNWATERSVAESVLRRRPGVLAVTANPVSQTATVQFDPASTSIQQLRQWVIDCGYHCEGQSVPRHICDPLAEPQQAASPHTAARLDHRADTHPAAEEAIESKDGAHPPTRSAQHA